MKILEFPNQTELLQILNRPSFDNSKIEKIVSKIIKQVQSNGDIALKKLTKKFDKVDLKMIKVSNEEITAAEQFVSIELKNSIRIAAENISKFHKEQIPRLIEIETTKGVTCWQKPIAIEKVGLYIPGGTAPLISTVLMLAIPAKIAGCKQIIVCTPPDKSGKVNPAILYASKISGVSEVFTCGGAQAIAAMAYGTESIPKVDKIFGPGNQFVTIAKQMVSSKGIAIDLPAGPSELMVLADETANPEFIAADLLSQAEHGADSQVMLVTNSKQIADQTIECLNKQLESLPRKEITRKSLLSGAVILVRMRNK